MSTSRPTIVPSTDRPTILPPAREPRDPHTASVGLVIILATAVLCWGAVAYGLATVVPWPTLPSAPVVGELHPCAAAPGAPLERRDPAACDRLLSTVDR